MSDFTEGQAVRCINADGTDNEPLREGATYAIAEGTFDGPGGRFSQPMVRLEGHRQARYASRFEAVEVDG